MITFQEVSVLNVVLFENRGRSGTAQDDWIIPICLVIDYSLELCLSQQ